VGIKSIALAATTLVLSTNANSALIIDQQSTYSVSGGVSTQIQSFTPAADNIAGVDAYLYSVASFIEGGSEINYTANVSLKLYAASGPEDFLYINNDALATANFTLDTGTSRTGWAELRWDAIQVTPETYYIMELTTDNGVFGNGINTYDRGQRLEPGLQRDYFDLNFKTYFDDTFVSSVPIPAAVWLFGSGLIGLIGIARRKKA
jgi:hypothetical protein